MAGETSTISVKNPEEARKWLAKVHDINERFNAAMESATNAIKSVQEFGEGTYVDELVNFADAFLNASKTVFQTIDKIADTVNGVLGFAGNFLSDAGSAISGVFKKILG